MSVVLARIDQRLIHGIVVTQWQDLPRPNALWLSMMILAKMKFKRQL